MISLKFHKNKYLFIFISFLIIIGGILAGSYLKEYGTKEILDESTSTITYLSQYLKKDFSEIKNLSKTLSLSPEIRSSLQNPLPETIQKANRTLDNFQNIYANCVFYLMNNDGLVIATSNRKTKISFLGKNYKFRKYFKGAKEGKTSTYFAVGITSKERGYYSASPVKTNSGQILGVLVVKQNIDSIAYLLQKNLIFFLTSPKGIVFISNNPRFVLKSIRPIAPDVQRAIFASKQFGTKPFEALFEKTPRINEVVKLKGVRHIVNVSKIGVKGWRLFLLMDMHRVLFYEFSGYCVAALLFLINIIVWLNSSVHKKKEKTLEKARKYSEFIFQAAPEGMFTADLNKKITAWNDQAEKITGFTQDEMIGINCDSLVLAGLTNISDLLINDVSKPISKQECTIKLKNGTVRHILKNLSFIEHEEGRVIGYIESFSDITEMKRLDNELKEAKNELEAQAWGLEKTNEAIKVLYKDLEKKNKDLQRLDELKSDFVSTVSHELRTPLAISTEGINLVVDGITGSINEQQKDLLMTARDNLFRLNMIINDLLDIQKIESGKIELKRGLTDIKETLQKITHDYEKVCSTKKQTLRVSLPDEEISIYIDEGKIIQVLTNLLNNAHKFTPEGGTLEVTAIKQKKELVCSIKDTGMGISKENMSKLFGKFQQFARTDGAGIKGTGLGLSIARAMVEMHGGKIWAESQVDQGTTFSFTLPLYTSVKQGFDRQFDDMICDAAIKNISIAFITLKLVNHQEISQKFGEKKMSGVMNAIIFSFSDVLTRPGDEFILYDGYTICILLPLTDRDGGSAVIARLKKSIEDCKLKIDRKELNLKFGLALYPEDAKDRKGLFLKASGEKEEEKNS